MQCRRGDDQVVCANQLALRGQIGVQFRVTSGDLPREVQYRQAGNNWFNERGSPVSPGLIVGTMHTHEEFRYGYRADEDTFGRLPRRQIDRLAASLA
jgi:hypothetical protein